MANIMDYLDWRGDIPFSVDPFNEVDNLVLAELAYVQYDGVVPGMEADGSMAFISLEEAIARFFAMHTEEELEADQSFTRRAPYMLPKMASSRRFAGTRIGGFVNIIDGTQEEQMSAVTFLLPDGTAYAAFRGTDNSVIGWKEDFNLSFSEETRGQHAAAAYLTVNFSNEGCPLRVGGHSKGGNFAVYASAFCSRAARNRIIEVWSNDGPGFIDSVIAAEEYRSLVPLVRSIIPAYSVFGLLLGSEYKHKVIESAEKGIMQHDAMSWQVLGNHFVEAPGTTEGSAFLKKTIDTWIAGFDMEARESFVNLMYDLVQSQGVETVSQLNEDRLKNYWGMIKTYRTMEEEEQKVVRTTLSALLHSGAETLAQSAPTAQEAVKAAVDKIAGNRQQ